MTSIPPLLKRIDTMMAIVKAKQQQLARRPHIVIYDPLTHAPLPGYEPRLDGVTIWLPDNGRDGYSTRSPGDTAA